MLGRTEPRIFTPPLRELTPETSYGFGVIAFARDVLFEPLDPWEECAAIRAGELLPDGRPRFRVVLILVARQNGKSTLLRIMSLFWMFVEEWEMILGLSTDRTYARRAMHKVAHTAIQNTELKKLLPRTRNNGLSAGLGQESFTTAYGSEYTIAATNRRAGRSLTVSRAVIDEIREHRSWDAWNACKNAMNAQPYAQAFCISNQGDEQAIVLDSLREDAISAINANDTRHRTGLFEWSAPDGCSMTDPNAIAQANPNLGRRLSLDDLIDELRRAERNGGREEADARTEILCQRVRTLDGAVDQRAWNAGAIPGDLCALKSRIALCLDVSRDQQHATLVAAAAQNDGCIRVQLVTAWHGMQAIKTLGRDVRQIVREMRPQTFGWLPIGPAASHAAALAARQTRTDWPPPGVTISEIRAEVTAVCMGFAAEVEAGRVVHSDEQLLNAHVTGSGKLWSNDTWKFSRRGYGHCDAAYAAAGAVHLARTLPTPIGTPRIIVASSLRNDTQTA